MGLLGVLKFAAQFLGFSPMPEHPSTPPDELCEMLLDLSRLPIGQIEQVIHDIIESIECKRAWFYFAEWMRDCGASRELPVDVRLRYLKVSYLVINNICKRSPDDIYRRCSRRDCLGVRYMAINICGVDQNDPLLNTDDAENEFRLCLDVPLEVAIRMKEQSYTFPTNQHSAHLRNTLDFFSFIEDRCSPGARELYKKWCEALGYEPPPPRYL